MQNDKMATENVGVDISEEIRKMMWIKPETRGILKGD
jgi:hypothetical protein